MQAPQIITDFFPGIFLPRISRIMQSLTIKNILLFGVNKES